MAHYVSIIRSSATSTLGLTNIQVLTLIPLFLANDYKLVSFSFSKHVLIFFFFFPVNSPLLFVKVRLTSFDIFSLSSLPRPLNTVALQQRFTTPLLSLLSVRNAVDFVLALHTFSAPPRVWGLIKKLKRGNFFSFIFFLAVSFRVRQP